MPKKKREISYVLHGVADTLMWDVEICVPRIEVPELCRALQAHASAALGASFYYPNPMTRTTTCRYEWFAAKGSASSNN